MVALPNASKQQYPLYNTGTSAEVVALQEQLVKTFGPRLLLLLGAVSFVLLIACANVANLLLARACGTRGREVAIRTSMGASRAVSSANCLTESVLALPCGWGIFGLLLGLGLSRPAV